jgi:lipoprotein NlpD
VNGQVIAKFSKTKKLNKGIDIAAPIGTAIKSSRSGSVVYAGSRLKGYGNLIIVKHDKGFLSAYAHNQSILVKEGDWVKQGQKIATLGSTASNRPKLHFEIRQSGKPVNPLKYLAR